ncbi:MAG: biosynthetic-type acetolactate synthase large subunit [Planctomycetota bacterium]|nr:biosynthetic-type acetolactate synthase large subunit [Planctomycetota bacterium]
MSRKIITEPMVGARLLLECLRNEGVQVVFGYPGGATLPIYDALYSFPEIQHILVRHEQGAAHMADGYGRATGKVGVCMATSGPGATNLVTGIATAYMDSIPLVAITGQVKRDMIGNDAFQEADVTGICRPVTKHCYLLKAVNQMPRVIKEAFYLARTGRPGPVLIDIPRDIQSDKYTGPLDVDMDLPGYNPRVQADQAQLEAAAEAINSAERPVFYVGGGCVLSGAHRELRAAAERANIPVTTTLMAMGVFPGDHPLSLGMPGMHGTYCANYAMDKCDVMVSLGARFDDRITGKVDTFSVNSRKVHFDIDPTCIGKVVETQFPVVGDVRESLKRVFKHLKTKERKLWLAELREQKQKHPLWYPKDGLRAQHVVERICHFSHGKAIVTTDVGQHQMWTAQFYSFVEPRHFLTSGGLGTMGFGLPAAIGAAVGRPGEDVWCISSDGSIMMKIQELVTARRLKLPIKIGLMNNGHLGMVRQWQEMFWQRHYSHVILNDSPDFVEVAKAFGCYGLRCDKGENVDAAIQEAYKFKDAPVLVDFRVEPEENVYPMVPAGGSLEDTLHYPKGVEVV